MTGAEVNPAMLGLARRSRNLTLEQLGQLADIGFPALSRFEGGIRPVPPDTLARLANALDYPPAFFYQTPDLIGMGGGAVFHRKLLSLSARKLHQAHASAEIRRLEVTTLLQSLDEDVRTLPEYPVYLFEDDPAKIARSVRAVMNIPPGPIVNLTETLERNGCMVVAHDFGARQLDGFSQRPTYPPQFVHLNEALPPDRWRWTLAHELGHLVMHADDPTAAPRLVEDQANLFAAEFLTPAVEIRPMLSDLNLQKLGGLKRMWRVSMQALITRAYQLDAIGARQQRSLFIHLAKAGYRTREPATLDPPVEKPTWIRQLTRRHYDKLYYSPEELANLLKTNETDFKKYYSDDVWASIDDIVKDF